MKNYYKRYLPHLTPAGGIFFITSTLKDSLPKTVIQDLKAEKVAILKSLKTAQHLELSDTAYQTELINTHKRHFAKIDRLLDTTKEGKHYLKNPAAAQILADKFHKYEGEYYRLEAYTIMSNHFHLLIDTSVQLERLPESVEANDSNHTPLSKIMNLIKEAVPMPVLISQKFIKRPVPVFEKTDLYCVFSNIHLICFTS